MKEKHSSVILVFNNKGELALQLRAHGDSKYPLHWDFSAAGGIEKGESHKEAALRELREEIGIESDLQYLGEEFYKDELCTDQLYVYKTIYDGPFVLDPNEVEEVRFFSKDKIEEMLKSGEKFHPEFPFIWNKGVMF